MSPNDTSLVIVAACLYVPFFVLAAIWAAMVMRRGPPTNAFAVVMLLVVSMFLRTAWLFLRLEQDKGVLVIRALNRAALLLQFSALSIVVMHWVEVLDTFGRHRRATRLGFIMTNIVLYVGSFATLASAKLYDANIIILSFSFIAVMTAFLSCGMWLRSRLLRGAPTPWQVRTLNKVMIASATCGFAFFVRGAMFIYQPITNQFFPGAWDSILYPYAYYHLPEALPNLVILFVIGTRRKPARTSATKPLVPSARANGSDQDGLQANPLQGTIRWQNDLHRTLDTVPEETGSTCVTRADSGSEVCSEYVPSREAQRSSERQKLAISTTAR